MWAVHQSPWDQRSCHSICRVRSHAIHHGVGTTWLPFLGQGNKHIMVYRHDPCLSLVLQYNHALPLALQRVYARHAHEPSIFLPPLRVFHDIHVSVSIPSTVPLYDLFSFANATKTSSICRFRSYAIHPTGKATLPEARESIWWFTGGVSAFPFIATSMT